MIATGAFLHMRRLIKDPIRTKLQTASGDFWFSGRLKIRIGLSNLGLNDQC